MVGPLASRTCDGAKSVAGVAEAAATTGGVGAGVFACATDAPLRAGTGDFASLDELVDGTIDDEGAVAGMVVSTVGESAGA
jgi:hypothetical protein